MEAVRTGIARLDEALGGGVPPNATLLFSGEPDADIDAFALRAFCNMVNAGTGGALVTTDMPHQNAIVRLRRYGCSARRAEEGVVFVDCYSRKVGRKSGAEIVVENAGDKDEVFEKCGEALGLVKRRNRKALLGIFSVSSIVDMCGESRAGECPGKLVEKCREESALGIFTFARWPYEPETIMNIEGGFDALVRVGNREQMASLRRPVTVERAAWLERFAGLHKNQSPRLSVPGSWI